MTKTSVKTASSASLKMVNGKIVVESVRFDTVGYAWSNSDNCTRCGEHKFAHGLISTVCPDGKGLLR